jgi:hypothetical protein
MTDAKDVPINWEFTLRHLAAHCDSVSLHCAIRARLVEEVADHIATLTRKLNALTLHMNQVHATLGGTDTVLTLEAAQHVVFEREKWEKRARKLLRHRKALREERDAARTVTDAMINKGWSLLRARCVEEYKGLLDLVERDDFADAITAALTQEDA